YLSNLPEVLRISELLPEVIARIEPGPQSAGRSGRRFPECESCIAMGLKLVVRNRHYRIDEVVLPLVIDVYDMPIGTGIGQLEYVCAGIEISIGDLDRLIDRKNRLLVPLIRLGTEGHNTRGKP